MSLFDCFRSNFTGAPGCDYKPLDFCFDYEPNAGGIRQVSTFVKENPGIATLIALTILSAIIICSTYFGFGDFHHFVEWVDKNPSAFTAILLGTGISGIGVVLWIYRKSGVEEEEEAKLTEAGNFPYDINSYSALNPSNFDF